MKILVKAIFLTFIFTNLLFAQKSNTWKISGIVTDANGEYIPGATVYINNSTENTTTDNEGKFSLLIPLQSPEIVLIASYVGFKSQSLKIRLNDKNKNEINFKLIENNNLSELVVTAKRDRFWNKKWRIFENGLLGESDFENECRILNTEVIKLDYENKTRKVIAIASEPIQIQNNALGYIIKFQMDKFESDGQLTFISGYKYFEEIQPEDEKQKKKFAKNRQKAYENSFRNFLSSLVQNRLEENGFEVFKIKVLKDRYIGKQNIENELASKSLEKTEASKICFWDKQTDQFILISETPLLIFAKNTNIFRPFFTDYPYKYSQIILPRGTCSFSKTGWVIKPNGMIIREFWGHEGFSSLLPDNYAPNTIMEPDSTNIQELKVETKISQTTVETDYEQNLTLEKTTLLKPESETDNTLLKTDYVFKIKDSDFSQNIYELLRRIPGLKVVFQVTTGSYSLSFLSSNTVSSQFQDNDHTPALLIGSNFYSGRDMVMAILDGLNVPDIESIGAIKYGNNAGFGARGGDGTIVIKMRPWK